MASSGVATGPLVATSASPGQPLGLALPVSAADSRGSSLKRAREVTPASTDDDEYLMRNKLARLISESRQSPRRDLTPPPLMAAAAREDERRRREEDRHQNPPSISENPRQTALDALMSASAAEPISRPPNAPASSSMTTAAAADTSASGYPMRHGSPHSLASASGASLEDHAHSAHALSQSPESMDLDSRDCQPQPESHMEDSAKPGQSLSYPGVLSGAGIISATPGAPVRGWSASGLDDLPQSPSSSTKKHRCPHCKTEFTRHHNLKSHLLTHSQEKPYSCPTCQMRFRRLHDLKRHTKLHTGEKPHICPKCNRKFARGDALARHSKGGGGCAGQRSSLPGGFGDEDDFEASAEMEESAMAAVMYANAVNGDMAEDRQGPSLASSVKGPGQELGPIPNAIPPATRSGASPGTGLFTPNTGRTTFAPAGPMTESPKPLTPAAGTQQARPANLAHGTSNGVAASTSPADNVNNLFASGDQNLWMLLQNLDSTIKKQASRLDSMQNQMRQEHAVLEQRIASQATEIAALRQDIRLKVANDRISELTAELHAMKRREPDCSRPLTRQQHSDASMAAALAAATAAEEGGPDMDEGSAPGTTSTL